MAQSWDHPRHTCKTERTLLRNRQLEYIFFEFYRLKFVDQMLIRVRRHSPLIIKTWNLRETVKLKCSSNESEEVPATFEEVFGIIWRRPFEAGQLLSVLDAPYEGVGVAWDADHFLAVRTEVDVVHFLGVSLYFLQRLHSRKLPQAHKTVGAAGRHNFSITADADHLLEWFFLAVTKEQSLTRRSWLRQAIWVKRVPHVGLHWVHRVGEHTQFFLAEGAVANRIAPCLSRWWLRRHVLRLPLAHTWHSNVFQHTRQFGKLFVTECFARPVYNILLFFSNQI